MPRTLLVTLISLTLSARMSCAGRERSVEREPASFVRVRVVDDARRPIAGVALCVEGADRARTDADGRACVVLSGERARSKSMLALDAAGWAPRSVPFQPLCEGELNLGEITLGRGARVSGRVLNASGAPENGAVVFAADASWDGDPTWPARCGEPGRYERSRRVATRSDGSFALEHVGAGGVRVWAQAGDEFRACSAARFVRPGERVDGLELRLGRFETARGTPVRGNTNAERRFEPAAKLSGRVVASGAPVPGARVTLWRDRAGDEATSWCTVCPSVASTTDALGRFELNRERDDECSVRVEASGFATLDVELRDAPGGDGAHELALELAPGGALQGRLRMPPGRCDEGVIVAAMHEDGRSRTQRTAEGGHFRFENLASGTWTLSRARFDVGDDPFSCWALYAFARHGVALHCEVRAGETTSLELDLSSETPAVLRGAFFVNGAPATGWLVGASPATGVLTADDFLSSVLDERGEFEFVCAAPGSMKLTIREDRDFADAVRIRATTELARGEQSWRGEITTLRQLGRSARPTSADYRLRVSIHGDKLDVSVPLHTDATGNFETHFAIEGRAVFRGETWRDGERIEEEALYDMWITRGKPRFVVLP